MDYKVEAEKCLVNIANLMDFDFTIEEQEMICASIEATLKGVTETINEQ